MKQSDFIDKIEKDGEGQEKKITVIKGAGGITIRTTKGSIKLGPDTRDEINQKHFSQYYRRLGLALVR